MPESDSRTSMEEIKALIYHDWIWLPKPLLCLDISLFQKSEHYLKILNCNSCSSCRYLACLSNHKYYFSSSKNKQHGDFFTFLIFVFCTSHLLPLSVPRFIQSFSHVYKKCSFLIGFY